MFRRIFSRRQRGIGALFTNHFIDARALYVMEFDSIPTITIVGELDGGKVFNWLHETYRLTAERIYQHNYFDYDEGKLFSSSTIYVFRNRRIVEIGPGYCQVLYSQADASWGLRMGEKLAEFRRVVEVREERVIGFARPSKN